MQTLFFVRGAVAIITFVAPLTPAQQFEPALNHRVNPYPTAITRGDFNGDHKIDLVVTGCGDRFCSTTGAVVLLSGNGRGKFHRSGQFVAGPPNTTADTFVSGDFNRDHIPDLVVVNNAINQFGNISVLIADGAGGFLPPVTYAVGGSTPVWAAVADFNGDSRMDLAISVTTTNSVAVLLGNGDGTFQPAVNYPVGSGPQGIDTADVNGDGKIDIVSADECGDDPACRKGTVSVLLGAGNGTFAARLVFEEGMFPLSVAVADFNGDHKPDLAVANPCGTDPTCVSVGGVGIMLGNGDGSFQAVTNYPATGYDTARLAVADFDGDHRSDVVALNEIGSDISVLPGNGDGTLQPGSDYLTDITPDAVTIGDFNGDGAPDLAVANEQASDISILFNSGSFNQPCMDRR